MDVKLKSFSVFYNIPLSEIYILSQQCIVNDVLNENKLFELCDEWCDKHNSMINECKKSTVSTNTNSTKYQLIKGESMLLHKKFTCHLCKARKISITTLPCGHFILCGECGKSPKTTLCPLCFKVIVATVDTYL